jgi:hypothetical protein
MNGISNENYVLVWLVGLQLYWLYNSQHKQIKFKTSSSTQLNPNLIFASVTTSMPDEVLSVTL